MASAGTGAPAPGARIRPDDVAHAAHVVQQPLAAAILEFAPQEADEDRQRIGGGRLAVAPDPLGDQVVAEHLLGVAQQQLKQVELHPGQRDHLAIAGHSPGRGVQGQVRVAKNVTAGLTTPEQGPHPGQELA